MNMLDENYIPKDDELRHEGVSKKDGAKVGSGRYPLGSGENPYQHLKGFYGEYKKLKDKGFSDGEIAESLGVSTGVMRARNTYYRALNETMKTSKAVELLDKGMTKLDISRELGVSPSTVTKILENASKVNEARIISTRNMLKDKIAESGWVDTGKGTEAVIGVKRTMLDDAVLTLQDEGYEVHNIFVKMGGTGKSSTIRALCAPGMTKGEVLRDKDNPNAVLNDIISRDLGETYKKKGPPVNISSKRIEIRYADDPISGADMDGVIELRRGVPDLDLGNAHYAQVRIAVDGDLYAKGMAVYADDLPDGVDIRVNSNKTREQGLRKALKPQKHIDPKDDDSPIDINDPFGSATKEEADLKMVSNFYIDPKDGKEKQSALNFVNEESGWSEWSRNLPSQFLGKQPPKVARQQLNIDALTRQKEFDDIKSLTNPVLKEKLLTDFALNCDSAAVHLKAAALPRQATCVIIPSKSLKENEVYAPRLQDGDEVILVRFPHEGTFQIPRLKVNNKNREAKNRIGTQSDDAVCINPKTAEILSGADFDGDTVLVIPTKGHDLKNMKPLEGLVGYDAKKLYGLTDEQVKSGAFTIWKKGSRQEQTAMGKASNLITDMTLSGTATEEEFARAVRYSMCIIDVAKHKLDHERCKRENDIVGLMKKFQPHPEREKGAKYGGGATLLSRASAETEIEGVKSYHKTNPETGEREWARYDEDDPNRLRMRRKKTDEINPVTGKPIYEDVGLVPKTQKSTKMMEVKDAYTLTSGGSKEHPGTEIEDVYASYANRMKAMGNEARKEAFAAARSYEKASPDAKKVYSTEVAHLKAEINEAKKNAPLERKAQAIAQAKVELIKQANGYNMTKGEESKALDKELKKARDLTGASRYTIKPTEKEWEAIQAGALSVTDQKEILRFADNDRLRELAMPKKPKKVAKTYISAARGMLERGYTLEEVAKRFDISPSTLSSALNE